MAGVSFDRAAAYYDDTRRLPDDAHAAVTRLLAEEMAGRGLGLEIGVGTGRIAIPLHEHGVPLVGTDISPAMLNRLVFNAGGQAPFPLVVADATRLPFEDGSFEFVLACHVLHLIAQWQTVAAEVMRVLSPTGTLLVDFGGGAPSPWTKPARKVLHRHGIEHLRPGVSEPDALVNELHQLVSVRRLRPVEMVEHRSLAGDVFEWERQIQSWTWPYSPAQMKKACTAVRDWATRAGWSLEREIEVRRTIQWWAFDRIPR